MRASVERRERRAYRVQIIKDVIVSIVAIASATALVWIWYIASY